MAVWPFWLSRRRGASGSHKVGRDGDTVSPPMKGPMRKPSRKRSQRRRPSVEGARSRDSSPPKGKAVAASATWPAPAPNNGPQGSTRNTSGGTNTTQPSASATKELRKSPHLRPLANEYADIPYNFQLPSASQGSLPSARERGKLQRPSSLRYTGNETLPRRMSTKRRKVDQIREEEVRNMTIPPMPKPKRPTTYTSGLYRHDSTRGKDESPRRPERPQSEISVPTGDSVHSSMSSNAEVHAFRLSALAVFSARPTIRYTITPQYMNGMNHSQTDATKPRRAFPEEGTKQSRYINALADDLDASTLRELMDRDKRRKERKITSDLERAARKLRRREEKQQAAETKKAHEEAEAAAVGLGINNDKSAASPERELPTESLSEEAQRTLFIEETAARLEGTDIDLSDRASKRSLPPEPAKISLHDRPMESPDSEQVAESPMEEPVVAVAQAVRYSQASISPPRSPLEFQPLTSATISNVADIPFLPYSDAASQSEQGTDAAKQTPAQTAPVRRRSTLSSIFRRGTKRLTSVRRQQSQQQQSHVPRTKHYSVESFSNTSRDSMPRLPLPSHLLPIELPRTPGSSAGGAKFSRFHEDLPEMAHVRPGSRIQSPTEGVEANDYMSFGAGRPTHREDVVTDTIHEDEVMTQESPQSPEAPASPAANGRGSAIAHRSLASVDSEGSWLSGRAALNRTSKTRGSPTSAELIDQRLQPQQSVSASADDAADEDSTRQQSPSPDADHGMQVSPADMIIRRASNKVISNMTGVRTSYPSPPLAPEDAELEVPHGPVGRRPNVINANSRVKSSEGILNDLLPETPVKASAQESEQVLPLSPPSTSDIAMEDVQEQERRTSIPADGGKSPVSSAHSDDREADDEPVFVFHRAKSVDLGKGHVRHLSAGSAKLLDIPAKRQSAGADSKRASSAASSAAGEGAPQ